MGPTMLSLPGDIARATAAEVTTGLLGKKHKGAKFSVVLNECDMTAQKIGNIEGAWNSHIANKNDIIWLHWSAPDTAPVGDASDMAKGLNEASQALEVDGKPIDHSMVADSVNKVMYHAYCHDVGQYARHPQATARWTYGGNNSKNGIPRCNLINPLKGDVTQHLDFQLWRSNPYTISSRTILPTAQEPLPTAGGGVIDIFETPHSVRLKQAKFISDEMQYEYQCARGFRRFCYTLGHGTLPAIPAAIPPENQKKLKADHPIHSGSVCHISGCGKKGSWTFWLYNCNICGQIMCQNHKDHLTMEGSHRIILGDRVCTECKEKNRVARIDGKR